MHAAPTARGGQARAGRRPGRLLQSCGCPAAATGSRRRAEHWPAQEHALGKRRRGAAFRCQCWWAANHRLGPPFQLLPLAGHPLPQAALGASSSSSSNSSKQLPLAAAAGGRMRHQWCCTPGSALCDAHHWHQHLTTQRLVLRRWRTCAHAGLRRSVGMQTGIVQGRCAPAMCRYEANAMKRSYEA